MLSVTANATLVRIQYVSQNILFYFLNKCFMLES